MVSTAETNGHRAKTSLQVRVDTYTGKLPVQYGSRLSFKKAREMRRDPTIALGRELAVAPILASSWTYESSDDTRKEFIKSQLEPIRYTYLSTALNGEIDFGWKGYEKIFKVVETPKFGTRMVLDGLEPLLNDITEVVYDVKRRKFGGLYQTDLYDGHDIYIDREHSLWVNFDDEGIGQYGESKMLRAEKAYDRWNVCDDAAGRYEEKIAGAHWVIHYPVGYTPYVEDSVDLGEVDNMSIAKKIMAMIKATGNVYVPRRAQSTVDQLAQQEEGWKIELLGAPGGGSDFSDRQAYYDKLKIRSMGLLERSALEGMYGTKAEATEHINVTLLCLQLKHEYVTNILNWHLVNQLLRQNWGKEAEGSVEVVAQPLVDEKQALFKEIYMALLGNEATASELIESLDKGEVMDSLKVPVNTTPGETIFDAR